MSMYLTPQKFRTLGFGVDLDGIEDSDLAPILVRASRVADLFCAVSQIPVPYSFLGGSVTTDRPEQHDWRLPENDFDIGQRRVYYNHFPLRKLNQFRIKVTNTQYVDISPSEIFINHADRCVEVISLAFTGVGLFGAIMPSLGLMRPVSEIAYDWGWDLDVAREQLYVTDGWTYRAENQFWRAEVAPTVYLNGAVQTTGYTVDTTEGTVTFDVATSPNDVVEVSYRHALPDNVRDAVGEIVAYLLGEKAINERGLQGLRSLKVDTVAMERAGSSRSGSQALAQHLSDKVPAAADLLDGYRFITVRGG